MSRFPQQHEACSSCSRAAAKSSGACLAKSAKTLRESLNASKLSDPPIGSILGLLGVRRRARESTCTNPHFTLRAR